jgi:hypothetical protein
MNTKLLKGISAVAALALVVACNNNKKEITKDQEERLNRVEADEKKNKETSSNLTSQLADYKEKKDKYDTDLAQFKTDLADLESREAKVKDNEALRTQLEGERKGLEERAASLNVRDQELDGKLDRINAAHKILETDGEAYYNGLLTRLADGKEVGIIFSITSTGATAGERDALSAKILSQSASPNFKKHGHEINERNLYASSDLVLLNNPAQLKAIHDLAGTLQHTKLFFYEVLSGRIRSVLTINYNKGSSFSRTIHSGNAFEIGSKIGSINLADPVAQAGFPEGCKPNLGPKCLTAISTLLDKTVKDNANKEFSLKSILHEEIKVSRYNKSVESDYTGDWSPAAPHSFGLDNARRISTVVLSHHLLLDGPAKTDLRLNQVAAGLLDKQDQSVQYAGIKAPVTIPGSTTDLSGLSEPDYMDRLSKLDAVLSDEE